MLRPVSALTPMGVLLITLSVGLACNFDTGLACPAQNPAEGKTPLDLHITVLQGEDSVNILKSKMAVKPVVEVRDKNNLPVADATVLFTAPDSGPRVTFGHGSNTFMTTTDANGRAVVTASKPVGPGPFKIRVKADSHGQVATTSIAQTNYLTVAAATTAGATVGAGIGAGGAGVGMSATMITIIAIGAAAAVGVAVGLSKGGGGSKGSTVPTGTIGAGGAPTIGAP